VDAMTEEPASPRAASAAPTQPANGGAASLPAVPHLETGAVHVLRRLERIEALDRERAPSTLLLGELRALVLEAEAWARAEADARARSAAAELGGKGKE